jgi:hypothetical protein
MITKWKVMLGSPHAIQVDHVAMAGEVVIKVDGKEILHDNLPRGRSLEHPFALEGKPCILRVQYKLERFGGMAEMETWDYELLVDGVTQKVEPKVVTPVKEPKKWWQFWK